MAVRQRASARTRLSAPQPRCRPAATGPRHPTSACTMGLSGSLAPAPRTGAAAGRIALWAPPPLKTQRRRQRRRQRRTAGCRP
eukprot:2421826-Prymnesium_polylepis.2